jgi:hypothetical protein
MNRVIFAIRRRFGLRWKKSFWTPSPYLVILLIYLLMVWIAGSLHMSLLVEEAVAAQAVSDRKAAEENLIACLNGKLYLLTDRIGTKCRLAEEIPL